MTLLMSQPQTVTTESLPPEWQNLATKADVAELRSRMAYMATKEDLAELRGKLAWRRSNPRMDGLFIGLEIGLVVALVQIALFFLLRSLG